MIIRFEIENFRSFNSNQSISMIPGNPRNKQEHVFQKNNVKLLNLSTIYGANASGKTNLIKSIDLFKFIVMNIVPSNVTCMYFKENIENKDKATKFEIEFIKNNSVYAYGIEVLLYQRKIISEWLYELYPAKDKEEMRYERELINNRYVTRYNEDVIKGEDKSRLNFVIMDMETNYQTLLITEMNRNKKISKDSTLNFFTEVYDWFESDLKVFFPGDIITKFDYVINKDSAENSKINSIVSSFDTGISSVRLEKINEDEIGKIFPKKVIEDVVSNIRSDLGDFKDLSLRTSVLRSQDEFFQISNVNNDSYDIETIKLCHGSGGVSYDFREESDGTRRLFDLLDILLTTDDNKVFIIDELDRSLHPNLTYKFIELFYKVALEKNIQLILTTHESKIMDLNLLRQDEIWFVERNDKNESEIYSLDSFKERYDKRVEKAYLEGRYGGIPVFKNFEFFVNQEGRD